jgi:hypothetical protein
MRSRQHGWFLLAAAAGAAVLLAACSPGSPAGQHRAAGAGRPGSPPAPASPAPSPGQGGARTGLRPPPPGITDRLVVRHSRLRAGTLLRVVLIVTYAGRAPVNLNRGCRPQWAAALTNRRFPPDVAFSTVCSAQPFLIRPGQNRLRSMVITTYQGCSVAKSRATRLLPHCGPDHRPPALPAGRYRLVLVGDGLPLPAPAPVPVTLTRSRPPGAPCPAAVPPAPR